MHCAIIYFHHDKFAIIYYNESDGNWEISLDKLFANSITADLYDNILKEFTQFLNDFSCCAESTSFDFNKYIYDYDDSLFYMVKV